VKITVMMGVVAVLVLLGGAVDAQAEVVTVDELLDVVGVDAVRFFFMMRKADSQMEFDLALATRKSQENPVYYVQYSHARICSILRQAVERGFERAPVETIDISLLKQPEELNLLKTISTFPTMIENAALELAPHKTIFYLIELASQFHSYYNKHKVLTDNVGLTQARLSLVESLRVVMKNGLDIIGLTAPEKM